MPPEPIQSKEVVNAQLVERLTTAAAQVKAHPGYQPIIVVPEGYTSETLLPDFAAPLPDHIRQNVVIDELQSFIDYVKQFATHTARIFATTNDKGGTFLAVLDYHEAGAEGKPNQCRHKAEFDPEYSPEFAAWLSVHGKPLTQELFLDHLRKWGGDLTSHTDADLIEIASSLDFTTSGEFSSHTERTNGGRKLLFNQKIEGTANLKGTSIVVPDRIALTVPVFTSGRAYPIGADILYRPQGGALKIIIELRRHQLVIRTAVKDLVEDITQGIGIAPFIGSIK